MAIWRRFLVLAALGFWQGGFAFYAAVVVPMGEQVLSSPIEQGFVTRRVTHYLNLAGGFALALLLWEIAAEKHQRRLRSVAWAAMATTLCIQVGLHPWLDRFLNAEAMYVLDHEKFYFAHRIYLIASTFQWLASLFFLLETLRAWHDREKKETPKGVSSILAMPEDLSSQTNDAMR